jgi:Uma2 family endonuclease
MAEVTPAEITQDELAALGIVWPPTQDELPCDDGMPMETQRHVMQLQLLMDPLRLLWEGRQDVYVGGNMFVYFSLEQVRNKDFRGPDFFAVLDVPKRERKSWVVWEEGKGPDVVIELSSESTAAQDKGEKKEIYQNRIRVPEYFWFDPFNGEWAGFILQCGRYAPIEEDEQGRLVSQTLGLALVRWDGVYQEVEARWLRWAMLSGALLPTPHEVAIETQHQAAEAQRQTAEAQRQAAEAQHQTAEAQNEKTALEALLTRYRERFGDLPDTER